MKRASQEQIAEALFYFPGLAGNFRTPSAATPRYNCLAWVLGETHRRWWVDGASGHKRRRAQLNTSYWPRWAPAADELASFLKVLGRYGYRLCCSAPCSHDGVEKGIHKIAIYTSQTRGVSVVNHFASQVREPGWWSSKLGFLIDVQHPLEALVSEYGSDLYFVRRPRRRW